MHVIEGVDTENFQRIAGACALYNSRRAARAITDLYDAVLAPSGVHATQFLLLVGLKNYAPVSMSCLAQGLHMDRTTLTRTLKPLAENGWVEITPGKDRRVQEVRLTAEGNDAFVRALPLWEQAQKQVQKHLGREAWGQMLTHLRATATLTTE